MRSCRVQVRYRDLSFNEWIGHRLFHGDLGLEVALILMAIGVLDSHREGGELFWRFDFWRAIMAPQVRKIMWEAP